MVQHALAVLDCEDAEKWHGHEQLYISRFGGPDATWDVFKCWDGQLPGLVAAAQYRAIFITGSHYSAYEDLPWISNLVAWLHSFVMEASCATKIVAVCFGSQVIARALGGKIGKNTSGRFVLTVEDLSLQVALREKRYFKAAVQAGDHSPEACQQLKVLESHGDQVLELPEGAELLATSPTAVNEIWTYQDRVLAIQGHPEMPCEEALRKILPFLSSNGRLSEEEAAASKHALENVEPDWATIQRIMESFITSAETSPAQGVEPAASGYSSWLPTMTLPSMPGMPAISLPSVPMPSMSLPGLSLPAWMPMGPYSSSPVATPQAKADASADSSSTAEQLGRGQEAARQSTQNEGDEPAASSDASAEASRLAEREAENKTPSVRESAPADSMSERAERSSLPISTHATGVHVSMAESQAAQPSGSGHASRDAWDAKASQSRIISPDDSQTSSTSAKAEEFLEHVSRAVAAELDGALCNMQLLFGVNTVARAEFQRILQELLHWGPLVEDMRRKQEQCMPMLKALDVMEARMDGIEAAIKALDQQSRKLIDGA